MKMREINKDCWTNYVIRKAMRISKIYDLNIVITDCRYKNELKIAKKNGFIPVKVKCSESIRLQRLINRDGSFDPNTLNHVSETELDDVDVDIKLFNDGSIEDLYKSIDLLMESLGVIKNAS